MDINKIIRDLRTEGEAQAGDYCIYLDMSGAEVFQDGDHLMFIDSEEDLRDFLEVQA